MWPEIDMNVKEILESPGAPLLAVFARGGYRRRAAGHPAPGNSLSQVVTSTAW
jgi:hypothetical protein